MISKGKRTEWIALIVFLGVCGAGSLIVYIGRMPIGGRIVVDTNQSDRFRQIMDTNGILIWTGIGSLGMMYVEFENPVALCAIDDLVLEDARSNNYTVVVEYKCIITLLNHSVEHVEHVEHRRQGKSIGH
jgi:hypothetical protein